MHSVISSNLHFLQQAQDLLNCLDEDLYTTPVMSFYGSTIGGHLRHCLEHYESFAKGIDAGEIDYDARARDLSVEKDPSAAAKRISKLSETISQHADTLNLDIRIQVKMDCGGNEDTVWQTSTIGREMQFLVSHTVHHFAMISGLCHALSIQRSPDFGMAPSTLRHQQTHTAAAK